MKWVMGYDAANIPCMASPRHCEAFLNYMLSSVLCNCSITSSDAEVNVDSLRALKVQFCSDVIFISAMFSFFAFT